MLETLLDGMREFLLKKENKHIQDALDEIRCLLDYDTAKISQVCCQSRRDLVEPMENFGSMGDEEPLHMKKIAENSEQIHFPDFSTLPSVNNTKGAEGQAQIWKLSCPHRMYTSFVAVLNVDA